VRSWGFVPWGACVTYQKEEFLNLDYRSCLRFFGMVMQDKTKMDVTSKLKNQKNKMITRNDLLGLLGVQTKE